MSAPPNPLPRARIIGPGQVVTLEDLEGGARLRARITHREGRRVSLLPLADGPASRSWVVGRRVLIRAARPFGLFIYRGDLDEVLPDGTALVCLSEARPRRRQLRGYFRMPVRLSVTLETELGGPIVILRARNLSGSGILVFDPESRLTPQTTVRIGLPVGNSGEILRLPARVVRMKGHPTHLAALAFDGISEGARQMLLRYLVRQHRKRQFRERGEDEPTARIVPIERP